MAILLTHANQVLAVDRLVDDLWLDNAPKTARHTVQAYVHRLRKSFGPEADRLETTSSGYRLHLSADQLDIIQFEELVKLARSENASPQSISESLSTALALWSGPVLADLPDLPSLLPEIARLESMRTAALEDRIEADLVLGRHHDVIAELEHAIAENPYRERLWGQLMLALYRSERQADALRTFQQAKSVMGDALGITPGPSLVELEGRILLQDPSLSLSHDVTDARPTPKLPDPRTSFVGRHRDLELVHGMLQRNRLVTITGPPGVGKTRLALELAGQARSDYPHGMGFVRLHETTEPTSMASVIAEAVTLHTSNRDPAVALFEFLTGKRMLLVLDNLEHLGGAPEFISRLMDSAPSVAVLVTSRAPIKITGEHVYRLAPLPSPSETADLSVGSPLDPAVKLFEDRARAVQPGFSVRGDNVSDVIDIVARLDGLPLAIELAAGRMGVLPLKELASRLEPALPLLGRGTVDGQKSHQTLTAAIAWSYDLLSSHHQAIFRGLSVFQGGFTLDQVEHVLKEWSSEELVEGVLDLVEANLIEGPTATGDTRFSFLETIREYACRSLRSAGEDKSLQRRHSESFAGLAEEAEIQLTGADQTWWLDLMTLEHPNLRAALAWAQQNDPEMGLLMAGRIWRFWQFRGLLTEGGDWLRWMLDSSSDAGFARIKGLIGLAGIRYWQTDFDAAEAAYSEALQLIRHVEDPALHAEALFGQMQTLACARGEVEAAIHLEEELHELAANSEEPVLAFMEIAASGAVRYYAQDWEGAQPYMTETLEVARTSGNRWMEREILFGLASSFYFQGRYDQAEAHLRQALVIAHEMKHMPAVAAALYWLGLASVLRGDPEGGVLLAGAAARIREDHGGGFVAEDVGLVDMTDPVDAARQVLDEVSVDRAWAKGWSTRYEDLVSNVISIEPPAPNRLGPATTTDV